MSSAHTVSDRKYVFVCGLPRSGTSVLGRNIGRLEDCTEFKNTGVLEDEGQYLQDVYPVATYLGGAGDFGFHPDAHRTDESPLLTPEKIARLRECWHAHWDPQKPICVEKTPGNLLMTRFLQAAFPNSYFVVVKRHPLPVAMAVQKWKIDVVSLDRAIQHWIHCYGLYEQDKRHLERVLEFKYEDYVVDADAYHRRVAEFIGTNVAQGVVDDSVRRVTQWRRPGGLEVSEGAMEETSNVHNKKYFDGFSKLVESSACSAYYRHLVTKFEPVVAEHGYSLREGLSQAAAAAIDAGPTSPGVGELYCRGAALCALGSRVWTRGAFEIKSAAKSLLGRGARTRDAGGTADRGACVAPGEIRQLDRYSG